MGNITAQLLATLIQANTDLHLAGRLSRAKWDAAQRRLWRRAERAGCQRQVVKLLAVGR